MLGRNVYFAQSQYSYLCRGPAAVSHAYQGLSLASRSYRTLEMYFPVLLKPVRWKLRKLRQKMFRESQLAHKYLDGLRGLEIGGAAHNGFGLNTLNIDYSDDMDTSAKRLEFDECGQCLKVDIVAQGDALPFKDESVDFVLSSHVIEHFYDPIRTIKEWMRVTRKGGYVFIIAPHKERTPDKARPRTSLQELLQRHQEPQPAFVDPEMHHSVWITEDFVEICNYCGWQVVAVQDVDDKVGNGFTVVLQKQ